MLELEPNWFVFYQRNNVLMFLASNLVLFLTDFISILITIYFNCQLFFDENNMCTYYKIYVLSELQVYFEALRKHWLTNSVKLLF